MMTDDTRKNLKKYSVSGGISVSLENGLPISGTLTLLVGASEAALTQEIFHLTLPQPLLSSHGIVVQPGIGSFDIELDQSKLIAISEATLYKFRVVLDDAPEATLTENDFLIVRDGFISGSFLFDPEGLADDEDNNN